MASINRDGLSDAEFEEARGMCEVLIRLSPGQFLYDMLQLIENRAMTRRGLDAVRRAYDDRKTRREKYASSRDNSYRRRALFDCRPKKSRPKVTLPRVSIQHEDNEE